jgi:hypothetical protein
MPSHPCRKFTCRSACHHHISTVTTSSLRADDIPMINASHTWRSLRNGRKLGSCSVDAISLQFLRSALYITLDIRAVLKVRCHILASTYPHTQCRAIMVMSRMLSAPQPVHRIMGQGQSGRQESKEGSHRYVLSASAITHP